MTNVHIIQNGGTEKAVVKGFYNHLLFAMLLFCFCLLVRVRPFGMIWIRITDPRSFGSGSLIQDHSDHGRSNDPMNPCSEWIHHQFI